MIISPQVWGPLFWHVIHIVALSYPIQEPSYGVKRHAKEFFESLASLIPCPVCRDHYTEHLKNNPISTFLDKRADLFRWTVMLHNEVNKTLGKSYVSEQEAVAFYKKLGERNRSPVWTSEDFKERDMRSFIQGITYGFVAAGIIGGLVYFTTQYKI